jgi:hypothetical protein
VRRTGAIVMVLILSVSACSSGPSVPSVPQVPGASIPTPQASREPSPDASMPPQPSGAGTMTPLPADIVEAVDQLVEAATDAERIEAASAMLSSVGVTISDDEDAVPETHAGLVLAPEEVETMAIEAGRRDLHRATLAEFAEAFGGMAFLPPNDALAAGLPDDWVDVPSEEVELGADERADLQLGDLAPRMATVVTSWVASAIQHHEADDPDLVELTNAPLLLAELARRRAAAVDLAQPFVAGDLRLGWLEITILTAGMRSMLVGVEAAGIAVGPPPSVVLAMQQDEPTAWPAPLAAETPCDNLKAMLDSRVPLASTVIRSFVGDQIKGFIQNFVNALFGQASAFAQNVGRAFKVLSVMFKVQALIMLYSEATATVEMDPTTYHKPDGNVLTAAATVTAGIPDGAWEAAQQARQLTPFSTALRVCARHLGLPVWQDLVDIGDALDGWQVGWSIRQGAEHVQIPTRDQFWGPGAVPGRLEKPISRVNDHRGYDILGYEVLTERREDHPGTEMEAPVELCAQIYPKAPPGGFGTILSAGTAGASMAGGSYLGLVAVIANLLTAWVSSVHGIDACGQATVSYHIATPGTWRGVVTANTEVQESSSSTTRENRGPPVGITVSTYSTRTSIDVTDRFFLGGTDEQVAMGYVALDGRQYTNGAMTAETVETVSNGANSSCFYDKNETGRSAGGWFFEVDASGSISLYPDGRYTISFFGSNSDDEIVVPGELTSTYSGIRPASCNDPSETVDRPAYPHPTVGSGSVSIVEGQLDPEDPGNVLRGQATITNSDLSVTTITWNIVHEGPIRLPFQ